MSRFYSKLNMYFLMVGASTLPGVVSKLRQGYQNSGNLIQKVLKRRLIRRFALPRPFIVWGFETTSNLCLLALFPGRESIETHFRI